MGAAGYEVMNIVACNKPLDPKMRAEARMTFAEAFQSFRTFHPLPSRRLSKRFTQG